MWLELIFDPRFPRDVVDTKIIYGYSPTHRRWWLRLGPKPGIQMAPTKYPTRCINSFADIVKAEEEIQDNDTAIQIGSNQRASIKYSCAVWDKNYLGYHWWYCDYSSRETAKKKRLPWEYAWRMVEKETKRFHVTGRHPCCLITNNVGNRTFEVSGIFVDGRQGVKWRGIRAVQQTENHKPPIYMLYISEHLFYRTENNIHIRMWGSSSSIQRTMYEEEFFDYSVDRRIRDELAMRFVRYPNSQYPPKKLS